MAKISAVDAAIASLDARIAELNGEVHALLKARELLADAPQAAPKQARKPRKKRSGLPANDTAE